jgi:hypothetical protein
MAMMSANRGLRLSLVGFALSLGASYAQSLRAEELTEIRIEQSGAEGAGLFPGWVGKAPFRKLQKIDLELGDDPYGAILRLGPRAKLDAYRVSVQFETSMAIGDEGPHIDLLDWKHCTSDWKVLKPGKGGDFVLPTPNEAESSCFPPSTTAEIKAALRSALRGYGISGSEARHWLELAGPIDAPGDQPSYLGISKVRVRVEQRGLQGWWPLTMIEFMPPLGC